MHAITPVQQANLRLSQKDIVVLMMENEERDTLAIEILKAQCSLHDRTPFLILFYNSNDADVEQFIQELVHEICKCKAKSLAKNSNFFAQLVVNGSWWTRFALGGLSIAAVASVAGFVWLRATQRKH